MKIIQDALPQLIEGSSYQTNTDWILMQDNAPPYYSKVTMK
jgi:hypothetical protein